LGAKHDLSLPLFDRVPQVIFDNAKLRDVLFDHRLGLVHLGAALAGVGILQVAELVPDELADVDPVVKYPGTPCGIAIDSGCTPAPAAWAGNAIPVEP
jgi:hypothetical protein